MARRPTKQQNLQLESLETRQMLSVAGGTAVSGSVAPTAEKQYMLELVNLVRTDPGAAAQRITSDLSPSTVETLKYYNVNLDSARQRISNVKPRQPLAWNDQLASAAQEHSDDMASKGYQSHTGSDGSSPDQRIERAGYKNRRKTLENAFAYAESVDQAMQAFTLDWGVPEHSHLRNMTDPDSTDGDSLKEVGFGITNSSKPGFAKVVTQDFGLRNNSPTYLLGVAYNDKDHDRFYTPGEGQGGVEIDLTNDKGQTVSTSSGAAGGYQVPLAPGHYHLRALLNGQEIRDTDINIGSQNVKVDFILSDPVTTSSSSKDSGNNQAQTLQAQPPKSDANQDSDKTPTKTQASQPQAQQITPPKQQSQPQPDQSQDSGKKTESKTTDQAQTGTKTESKTTTVAVETTPKKSEPKDQEDQKKQDAVDCAMILRGGPEIDQWETWNFVPMG